MSNSQLNQAVACEVRRILEQAAFLFTEDLAQPPSEESWASGGVALTFSGTPKGCIHFWTTGALMQVAAENMLGLDPDSTVSEQRKMDTLKELLNISAGHIMTAVYGKNLLFELGIPEILDSDQLMADMGDAAAVWISAEDEPLLVVYRIE